MKWAKDENLVGEASTTDGDARQHSVALVLVHDESLG